MSVQWIYTWLQVCVCMCVGERVREIVLFLVRIVILYAEETPCGHQRLFLPCFCLANFGFHNQYIFFSFFFFLKIKCRVQILYWFFCVVLCWALKIHYVDLLTIFLIYLKTLKLVVINKLWRHNRETTPKNPADNPNSQMPLVTNLN